MKTILILFFGLQSLFQDFQVGKKYYLISLYLPQFTRNIVVLSNNKIECGTYFWLQKKAPEGKSPQLYFEFLTQKPNGEGIWNGILTSKERVTTVIDNSLPFPSATLTGPRGPEDPMTYHWIIGLPSFELESAMPCVPAPLLEGPAI